MSQEFIIVRFPENRAVFSGTIQIGTTNQPILVEGGSLEITLGGKRDYFPVLHSVVVRGSSPEKPFLIVFEKFALPQIWSQPNDGRAGSRPDGPSIAPQGGGPGY